MIRIKENHAEGELQLKRWPSIISSLLGGGAMALAFIPYDIPVLVWVALLPLLAVLWLRPRSFWGGFGYGWLYGLAYYGLSFSWIIEVGEVFQIPTPLFLGIAFIPLISLYALLPALWAGIASTLLRPAFRTGLVDIPGDIHDRKLAWGHWSQLEMMSSLRCAVGLGALWVCIEWLRGHGTLAFSWNSLGIALYDGLSLVQWAEFVGTTALSFLPVCFSVILYCAARRSYVQFKGLGRGCRPMDFYGMVLLLFILFMGGLQLAQQYSPLQLMQKESCLQLPVLAIQTNLGQKEKITTPRHERHLYTQRQLNATGEALRQIQKDTVAAAMKNSDYGIKQQLPVWIIWPESSLGNPLWLDSTQNSIVADNANNNTLMSKEQGLPALRQMIKEMGGVDFTLFSGADLIKAEPSADGYLIPKGMYNSVAIIEDNDFSNIRYFAKQHLMPFGEYIPFTQSIEWVGKIYSDITGTQTGDGILRGTGNEPIPVRIPGTDESVSVIPAVCYEDTLGDLLIKFARKGPQVIVNASNDAWFQESACGEQQARSAAFRCIELRRPMVRAANQGLCCSIAPNGAPIHELRRGDGRPWRDGYSYAVLPVDKDAPLTLYARFGDWAVLLCAIVATLLSLPGLLRRAGK